MNCTLVRGRVLVALLGTLALATAAQAQPPHGDDIQQTVVRVAYLSGQVSYSRGDNPEDWQPASRNFPMTLGDRLYTARGSRLELQTEGAAIYLAPDSDFGALNLTYDVKQFSLGTGSASFFIRHIGSGEFFEVDTPNAAVTFDRAGQYRIDVDRDGNTRVIVNRGHAFVAAAGGEVPLDSGRMMAIDGIDSPFYDVTSLPRRDAWDRWVETRSRRFVDSRSLRYVNAEIPGVDDLDQYGTWSQIPEYGNCWSPRNVPADWQPYRAGRWAWQDPWGWSWVSNEPWGWAPYHYGRWVTSRSRWYWVPVGPDVRTVRYAPALVAFVGGPGFSASISLGGGGNVGWFPLAPHDPFVPWWGSRAREMSPPAVTNVTYVNRTYVTVVNQNTFISGAPVATNTIRDARVLREVSLAPVVRGPLPVVPVASSIRVSTERAGSAPPPPATTLNRAVVTRLAPAPAPAPFSEKANLIRENRGAPVDPAQAARLAPVSREIQPTRSVVVESGRVNLAPKKAQAGVPAPVPVTREAPQGQARREAPPAGAREAPPGQAKSAPAPAIDSRKAQEAETVRKQQLQQQQIDARRPRRPRPYASSSCSSSRSTPARPRKPRPCASSSCSSSRSTPARPRKPRSCASSSWQQQIDSRKAQEAEAVRKQQLQQQQIDARKAQEAETVRKQQLQQQQIDSRKAQEAEAVRKQQLQQQQIDSRKAQEAEVVRKQQLQQQIDSRKAQEAEAVRKQQLQQQQIDSRKAQEAEAVRKQQLQQQQIDSRKAQEAEAVRKQQLQQQQIDSRKAQEAEAVRKQQLQQQQQPVAKQKPATGEKKTAPPTATPADQKKEKDDKAKDKKDQPDGKDQG